MHPSEFFRNPPPVQGGYCFVVMPFRAAFSDELYSKLRSALRGLDMTCHRADEDARGHAVMDDVVRHLAVAELVIADLTGNNPNVLYEVGLAHAVRCQESILLITQDVEAAPFDLRHMRHIPYSLDNKGIRDLITKISNKIKEEILPSRFAYTWMKKNPRDKTSEIYPGEDRKRYSFGICDVRPATGGADFCLKVFRHNAGPAGGEEIEEVDKKYCHVVVDENKPVPIPKLPSWAIRVHHATSQKVEFCACRLGPESA